MSQYQSKRSVSYFFDLIWRSSAVIRFRLLCQACGYTIERILQKPKNIVIYGLLGLVVAFLGYAWTTHLHGFPTLAAWLPVNGKVTFHFINFLTLVGFVFGALGIIFAVIQLRLYESRIEDYPDFYKWAGKSFEDFETGVSRDLWFMGSTILPGNVVHGIKNPEDIKEFRDRLLSAIQSNSKQTLTGTTRPIRLLLPHADGYEYTYGHFKRTRVAGVMDRADSSAWELCIRRCRENARNFQTELQTTSLAAGLAAGTELGPQEGEENTTVHWPVEMREVDHSAPQFQSLSQAYLICTDRRVTYATPIHYTKALGDQAEKFVVPQLVGYTTTNGHVVRALRQLFEEVWEDAEPEGAKADLKRFYARHLKDREVKGLWEDIQKKISDGTDINPILGRLDEVDHDHFLGNSATKLHLEHLNPVRQSAEVLDLGGGFGGPARYLASNYKANVTVIDVNSERVKLGDEMFQGLRGAGRFYTEWGNVRFLNADLDAKDLADITEKQKFDAVFSFLAILHCVEKRRILRKIPDVLKAGGKFVLTDFIAGSGFDRESAGMLKEIGCPSLLTREEYFACLNLGNGDVTRSRIVTPEWSNDAALRYKNICEASNKAALIGQYGEKPVEEATALYDVVNKLFEKKVIAGIEIWGRKCD